MTAEEIKEFNRKKCICMTGDMHTGPCAECEKEENKEIFEGTTEALENLTIIKNKDNKEDRTK